jgi:hypothetical protein
MLYAAEVAHHQRVGLLLSCLAEWHQTASDVNSANVSFWNQAKMATQQVQIDTAFYRVLSALTEPVRLRAAVSFDPL